MNPKKALIITYYWPPSGGSGVQRWVKFCKYLPEFGIDPIVLTVKNGTYPLTDKTLSGQVKNIEVHYAKSMEPYSILAALTGKSKKEISTPSSAFTNDENFIKKISVWIRSNFFIPDARVGWVPFAFSKAKELIEREHITTIITTGPPNSTHIIGTRLKKWKPVLKWIMDMRDPWSQIFYNEDLPRSSIAKSIDLKLEKKALQHADEVVVVSDGMATLQNSIFGRTYSVIPNGFDHEEMPEMVASSTNEHFVIKYIGTMTEPAIPHHFFKAVGNLSREYKSRIKLQFFGSYNQKVLTAIEHYKLNELISFEGYVPHLQAKEEMATADLLLLVIPNTKNNDLILTGKLFDYLAAQRPILYIGPEKGDAAKIIQDYRLGICFTYDDELNIHSFLKDRLEAKEIEYQKWERDFREHPFSRFSLTRELVKIMN